MAMTHWLTSKDEAFDSSVGRPDAVKELHDRVVNHEWDADVHTDPTKSRDGAFIEPAL